MAEAVAKWWIEALHKIPHFNFRFENVSADFLPEDWDYLQSVAFVWAVVSLLGGVAFLAVCISWICRCCCVPAVEQEAKRRRKVRSYTALLFLLSILAFLLLGACYFGNSRLNRGIDATVTGVSDVHHQTRIAFAQGIDLNDTLRVNFTSSLASLAISVGNHSSTAMNKTMLDQSHLLLQSVSNSIDVTADTLKNVTLNLAQFGYLHKVHTFLDRVENERWITFVVIFTVMAVVLFGATLAICTHSKKGIIVFSALGLAMFNIEWVLFALSFASSVGISDYCHDTKPFASTFLDVSAQGALHFYEKCDEKQNLLPPIFRQNVELMDNSTGIIQSNLTSLKPLLEVLFKDTKEIQQEYQSFVSQFQDVQKALGAVENSLRCVTLHSDTRQAFRGVCRQGVIGIIVLLVGMFFFGILLFVLLLCVSKGWFIYGKRPLDYVEVDEDDPFYPRSDRSTIPVDFYGTHVHNPRTRFASAGDHSDMEASGGSQIGGGGATGAPLWQRGNPPPAYDAVGALNNTHRVRRQR